MVDVHNVHSVYACNFSYYLNLKKELKKMVQNLDFLSENFLRSENLTAKKKTILL